MTGDVDCMAMDLHRAIRLGELEDVRRLLDAGADLNGGDSRGWTPLSRSIERGHPEIARLLLARGADVHARDRRDRQPLLWAAQYGPDDVAEALVVRGADVTAADNRGKTPLLQAARHGRVATVLMLLRRGDWPRSHKNYHWSLGFFQAIRGRRLRIVEAFLYAGQDPDSAWHHWARHDFYEITALMEAVTAGDVGVVTLLLRRGADVLKKSYRRSALTEALSRHGEDAAVTRTLLDHGACLGLEEAVVAGDLGLAERLLAGGVDVEAPDADGRSLLAWAAFHGRAEAARLLVGHGADPNASGRDGVNALMGAAAVGDTELMRFLIECGVAAGSVSLYGQMTVLAYAAGEGHVEAVTWLIARFGLGADGGASALTAAAAGDHLKVVRLLLNAGVDADAHTSDLYGRRALMWSAWQGDVPMTRLLLERGADVNARDTHGSSAASFAAAAGRKRVMPLLIGCAVAAERGDSAN